MRPMIRRAAALLLALASQTAAWAEQPAATAGTGAEQRPSPRNASRVELFPSHPAPPSARETRNDPWGTPQRNNFALLRINPSEWPQGLGLNLGWAPTFPHQGMQTFSQALRPRDNAFFISIGFGL